MAAKAAKSRQALGNIAAFATRAYLKLVSHAIERGNDHPQPERSNGAAANGANSDFDARILALEKTVGTVLYRSILREYERVNQSISQR
jgi:hypothetical protein